MKQLWLGVLLTGLLVAIQPTTVRAETETIDLKALAKKARPAVLLLVVSDAAGKEIATGTGFLVSSDGKLITNHHVIEGAASAVAKAENGGLFPVEGVLADDPKNDLVLLKLKAKDLPFLPLGDSEKIEVGTRIAVIGSPLGLEGTLSEGIISAIRESSGSDKWIQITAAISPGSSGSPVLDAKGEVLGIAASLIRGGQSLNFAIPSETAKQLLTSEARDGKPKELSKSGQTDDMRVWMDPEFRAYRAALVDRDFTGALRTIQSIVSRYPNSADAYFELGYTYGQLGFRKDAITAYREAVRIRPEFPEAWHNLGLHLCALGSYEVSVEAYQQAIKVDPSYAFAWSGLGTAFSQQKKFEESIAAFKQALKLESSDTDAWIGLGWVYCNQGKWSEGIDSFQRAVALKPDAARALGGLCFSYTGDGQFTKAWELVNKLKMVDTGQAAEMSEYIRSTEAVEILDNNTGNCAKRINRLLSGGDFDVAIAECNRVLSRNPPKDLKYVIYRARAIARSNKNDLNGEIVDLSEAIKMAEAINFVAGAAQLYNGRAWTYFKLGQYDKALADSNRAVKLKPDHAEAYGTRGWIEYAKGDQRKATSDLERAIALSPTSSEAFCDQGMLHYMDGKYDEAVTNWIKASEMSSANRRDLEPWIEKARKLKLELVK